MWNSTILSPPPVNTFKAKKVAIGTNILIVNIELYTLTSK